MARDNVHYQRRKTVQNYRNYKKEPCHRVLCPVCVVSLPRTHGAEIYPQLGPAVARNCRQIGATVNAVPSPNGAILDPFHPALREVRPTSGPLSGKGTLPIEQPWGLIQGHDELFLGLEGQFA